MNSTRIANDGSEPCPRKVIRLRPHYDGRTPQLADLQLRYQASGGLVRTEHLVELMRRNVEQPISQLARWIVGREVIHMPASASMWFPLFQFNPGCGCVRRELNSVLVELAPVFDDEELVSWFAQPNITLGGALPADLLPSSPNEVRRAARLDRFLAVGP
jgi:hypothetical protein